MKKRERRIVLVEVSECEGVRSERGRNVKE